MHTLSLNIKFICTRCETGLKSSLFCLFLKLVQINFIFTDNVRMLYIYDAYLICHQVLIFCSLSQVYSFQIVFHLYITTMYVYCVYHAMSKKPENLSDLNKKDRNKRHSSPFINVVKGVFFVVRVQINFIFTDNVRILYIYLSLCGR
jgi:hypothetical protein